MHSSHQTFMLLALLLLSANVSGTWSFNNQNDALKVLGHPENCFTIKSLKFAYRKRSLETHPDKGGSTKSFVQVKDAYDFLWGKRYLAKAQCEDNQFYFARFFGSSLNQTNNVDNDGSFFNKTFEDYDGDGSGDTGRQTTESKWHDEWQQKAQDLYEKVKPIVLHHYKIVLDKSTPYFQEAQAYAQAAYDEKLQPWLIHDVQPLIQEANFFIIYEYEIHVENRHRHVGHIAQDLFKKTHAVLQRVGTEFSVRKQLFLDMSMPYLQYLFERCSLNEKWSRARQEVCDLSQHTAFALQEAWKSVSKAIQEEVLKQHQQCNCQC